MIRGAIIARWEPYDPTVYGEGRFLHVDDQDKLVELKPLDRDRTEHFFYFRSNDNIPMLIGVSEQDLIETGKNPSYAKLREKYAAEFKQLEDAFKQPWDI